MRRTIALILISICMAAGAAGCSGGSSGSHGSGAPGGSSQTMTMMRQLAHCFRSHGMPGWPDPVINPLTGVPAWPQDAPDVPTSVQQACQSIANRLPPDVQNSQPPTATSMHALLRFAQCLRAHGVASWPDPNALGEFPLTTQQAGQFKSTADQRASNACIHYVPGGSQYLQFVGAAPPQPAPAGSGHG